MKKADFTPYGRDNSQPPSNPGARRRFLGQLAAVSASPLLVGAPMSAVARGQIGSGPLGPLVQSISYVNPALAYGFGLGVDGIPEASLSTTTASTDRVTTRFADSFATGQYRLVSPDFVRDPFDDAYGTGVWIDLRQTQQSSNGASGGVRAADPGLRVTKAIVHTDGLWWLANLNTSTGAVEWYLSTRDVNFLSIPGSPNVPPREVGPTMRGFNPNQLATPSTSWISEGLENDREKGILTNGSVLVGPFGGSPFVFRIAYRRHPPSRLYRGADGLFPVAAATFYPMAQNSLGEMHILNALFGRVNVVVRPVAIRPNDYSLEIVMQMPNGAPAEIREGAEPPYAVRSVAYSGVIGKHLLKPLTRPNGLGGYVLTDLARQPLPPRGVAEDLSAPIDARFRYVR